MYVLVINNSLSIYNSDTPNPCQDIHMSALPHTQTHVHTGSFHKDRQRRMKTFNVDPQIGSQKWIITTGLPVEKKNYGITINAKATAPTQ